jgi:serine/threonine-protein kinase
VAKSVDVTRLDFRDYHLHEQIGAGSFAKVYRAERISDGSTVAVKFLRKTWLRNKSAVARFAAEAQILTSLTHPHIAAISGWGRTPNQGYFLALQFAPGGDLQQRYRDIRPSWQQAVAYLSQVSSAVAFAHDHGIVHGDLKPGNVLLTAADNALVTDFGLAVPFAETRRSQVLTGTPAYLAPELLHSSATVASDVFGLGATLFFLLSGRSPYRGVTLGEMLTDLSSRRRLQLPADLRDSRPPNLTAFCERCLRREPTERFANVAAVANELAALSHI